MSHELAAIVIGGSAGALDALGTILPRLPAGLPVAVIVALHVLPGRASGLPEVLGHMCALPVKEAEDKEPIRRGSVYVVAPDYHLLVEKQHHFSLSADAPVNFSRPSIDVLFESAADAFGAELAGVLLSGANEDGARGLARIGAAGGVTIVQAPETASADAMPSAALRLGAARHVLAPAAVALLLVARSAREDSLGLLTTKEFG